MNTKKTLGARIRGWFPQDPLMSNIKGVNVGMKPTSGIRLPFLTAGALMILAAVLSAYFGFNLLINYQKSQVEYYQYLTDYASLLTGLLNILALSIDLIAASLLLSRKRIIFAKFLVIQVLAFGFAAPLISRLTAPIIYANNPATTYMYYGTYWLKGVLASLPMLAFSIPALVLIQRNSQKLKQDIGLKNWLKGQLPKNALLFFQKYPFLIRWMTITVLSDLIAGVLLITLGDIVGLTNGTGAYHWLMTVIAILGTVTVVIVVIARRKKEK
jgi:hypothetical protein